MTHAWESYVLGGVEKPKIVMIEDTNLCTNSNFETNLTGWTASSAADMERIADSELLRGDYCLRISSNTAGAYGIVYFDHTPNSGTIAGDIFLVSFMMKTEDQVRKAASVILCAGTSGWWTKTDIFVGPEWEQFTLIGEVETDAIGTFRIQFSPNNWGVDPRIDQYLRIDDVQLYKVTKQYTLADPQAYTQSFDRQIEATNETIEGTIKEYSKGYRYTTNLVYEYLNPVQEKVRAEMAGSSAMFFFPHQDSRFAQKVIWDKGFDRKYFNARYLGHTGIVSLKGVQLMQKQPTDIVGVGGYALDEWGASVS